MAHSSTICRLSLQRIRRVYDIQIHAPQGVLAGCSGVDVIVGDNSQPSKEEK